MSQASEDLVLLIGQIDGKVDILLERSTDYGKRISALEKDRVKLGGLIAGIAAAVSWFTHDKYPALTSIFH